MAINMMILRFPFVFTNPSSVLKGLTDLYSMFTEMLLPSVCALEDVYVFASSYSPLSTTSSYLTS